MIFTLVTFLKYHCAKCFQKYNYNRLDKNIKQNKIKENVIKL